MPAVVTKPGAAGYAAAEYVALVDPSVGLALADVLDELANLVNAGGGPTSVLADRLLRTADQLLAGAA